MNGMTVKAVKHVTFEGMSIFDVDICEDHTDIPEGIEGVRWSALVKFGINLTSADVVVFEECLRKFKEHSIDLGEKDTVEFIMKHCWH